MKNFIKQKERKRKITHPQLALQTLSVQREPLWGARPRSAQGLRRQEVRAALNSFACLGKWVSDPGFGESLKVQWRLMSGLGSRKSVARRKAASPGTLLLGAHPPGPESWPCGSWRGLLPGGLRSIWSLSSSSTNCSEARGQEMPRKPSRRKSCLKCRSCHLASGLPTPKSVLLSLASHSPLFFLCNSQQ